MTPLIMFLEESKRIKNPVVMEIGTRRVNPDLRTKHDSWVSHAREYIGVDLIDGEDVDVVADIHQLATTIGEEMCDIIITCSTFEHVKYPHLAAHQVLKTLRLGGLLYLHTVQTFPLHGFPQDYFRFSREGLASLFGTKMGFEIIETSHEFPAQIHSEDQPQLKDFDAFLNVNLFGKKVGPTPKDYIYEMESLAVNS
jgi:hypothetical protein